MDYRTIFACLLALAAFVVAPVAHAQPITAQTTLKEYISNLQKNPNNTALREKIIRHVQTMRTPPAIPDDARRYMNRGMAAAEDAKNEKDFSDAAEEFQKAVNAAPWMGAGYRGLAVTQEKSGQYAQALQNLKLFLLTNPAPDDAAAARTMIDKIEYRMEKAAKESSPEALALKQQEAYALWLNKIDRAQWRNDTSSSGMCDDAVIEVHGQEVQLGYIISRPTLPCATPNPYLGKAGMQLRGTLDGRNYQIRTDYGTYSGTVSEDGETIIQEFVSPSVSSKSTYTRVRSPSWSIWNR